MCVPSLASHIPISYNTMMGTATMVWLIGFSVGVMIAPRMKAMMSAYLRLFASHSDVTTPMRDRKKSTKGVSNTMPIQNRSRSIRSV